MDLVAAGLLGFCTVSAVYPPLRTLGNNAVLCLAALLVWFALALLRKPSFFFRPTVYRLSVYAFALYTALLPYAFGNDVISNRYLALLLLTGGFVVYEYYESTGQIRTLSAVLKVTCAFALVTGVRTIVGLMSDPYLSRAVKSVGEQSSLLRSQGIGGYELVYFAVLVGTIALHASFNAPNPRPRVFYAALYLSALSLVILSNYLTALLVLLLASVLVLSLRAIDRGRGFFVAVAIPLGVAVTVLFGAQLVQVAVQGIVDVSPTGLTADRLSRMTGSISNGLQQEFIWDRAPVMLESAEVSMSHPLLGLSVTRIGTAGIYLTGFGQHSHILDTFALFGLMVGAANVYVLFRPFHERLRNRRLRGLTVPFLMSYAMILIFNNATPSVAVAACLLFPLAFHRYATTSAEQDRTDGSGSEGRLSDDQVPRFPRDPGRHV